MSRQYSVILENATHKWTIAQASSLQELIQNLQVYARTVTDEKKTCGRCKQEKHISQFYTDTRHIYNRSSYCKLCKSERAAELRRERQKAQGDNQNGRSGNTSKTDARADSVRT